MSRLTRCIVVGLVVAITANRLLADEEAEHDALRKLKTIYEDAINTGDLDKFAPYLAKDFSAVLATSDEVKNLEELKGFWKNIRQKIGPGGTYAGTLDPDRSQLFGDIAVAHGRANEQVRTSSGQEIRFQTHWTAVFHKEDGQWKVIRAEATMDPFSNPLITEEAKQIKKVFGGGGLIIGLIAGFLARSLLRSRTK